MIRQHFVFDLFNWYGWSTSMAMEGGETNSQAVDHHGQRSTVMATEVGPCPPPWPSRGGSSIP